MRQVIESVIELVANGSTVKDALRVHQLTPGKFQSFLAGDRDLSLAYARALEIRADLYADEVIEISDREDVDPARARNQILARQWLAGKQYARRYGERIDLTVTATLDVSATLQEARARLLPIIDHAHVAVEEMRPSAPLLGGGPSDHKSVGPDIFSGKNAEGGQGAGAPQDAGESCT